MLHSDIGDYGVYIITVFDFSYIILLYALSLGIEVTDFTLIFNTQIPRKFKDLGVLTGFTVFLALFSNNIYHNEFKNLLN